MPLDTFTWHRDMFLQHYRRSRMTAQGYSIPLQKLQRPDDDDVEAVLDGLRALGFPQGVAAEDLESVLGKSLERRSGRKESEVGRAIEAMAGTRAFYQGPFLLVVLHLAGVRDTPC